MRVVIEVASYSFSAPNEGEVHNEVCWNLPPSGTPSLFLVLFFFKTVWQST